MRIKKICYRFLRFVFNVCIMGSNPSPLDETFRSTQFCESWIIKKLGGNKPKEALNKAEKSKANRQKERKKPSKELYGWRYPRISHTSQLKGRKSPKWVGVSRPR